MSSLRPSLVSISSPTAPYNLVNLTTTSTGALNVATNNGSTTIVRNVSDPVLDSDVATKRYVDMVAASGLTVYTPVAQAANANDASPPFIVLGTFGVDQRITNYPVSGGLQLNDRVLIIDTATPASARTLGMGLWQATTVGTTTATLTRPSDFNTPGQEINNAVVTVIGGNYEPGSTFVQTTNMEIMQSNIQDQNWVVFVSPPSYVGSSSIDITGDVISVADLGVTNAKLGNDSVTQSKLAPELKNTLVNDSVFGGSVDGQIMVASGLVGSVNTTKLSPATVSGTGVITCSQLFTTSDLRAKQVIEWRPELPSIDDWDVISYRLLGEEKDAPRQLGLVAQQLLETCPEAVCESPVNHLLAVDYKAITSVLVGHVRRLSERLHLLEQQSLATL